MSDATHHFAEEVRDSVEVLKKLRDEARVQAHLARLEAKSRFAELRERFHHQRLVIRRNLAARTASLRAFRDDIVRAARRASGASLPAHRVRGVRGKSADFAP